MRATKNIVNTPDYRKDTVLPLHKDVNANAWAVDAACSGNPGRTEYRGIDLQTGQFLFQYELPMATNNIGEFLAVVHAMALMHQRAITGKIIYTDSANAIVWVRKRQCKTKLFVTSETEKAYSLIRRAEKWLLTHNITVPLVKWETRIWGEIPADYGRKNR